MTLRSVRLSSLTEVGLSVDYLFINRLTKSELVATSAQLETLKLDLKGVQALSPWPKQKQARLVAEAVVCTKKVRDSIDAAREVEPGTAPATPRCRIDVKQACVS